MAINVEPRLLGLKQQNAALLKGKTLSAVSGFQHCCSFEFAIVCSTGIADNYRLSPFLYSYGIHAGSCQYSNSCLAEAAGFTDDDCCPAPSADVACSKFVHPCVVYPSWFVHHCRFDSLDPASTTAMDYRPVNCGPKSCEYPNLCVGEAAGFAADDCEQLTPQPAQTSLEDDNDSSASSTIGTTMALVGAFAVFAL